MRQIFLTIIASIPLAAQDPPSALVLIYREQVRPGRMAKVVQIEESAARFCATAHCPNPYFAITSITGPDEIWWINGFDSAETLEKVRHDYAANDQIMQQLNSIAETKGELVFPSITLLARFRDDLSFSSTIFAYTRYISISVVQVRPGQSDTFDKDSRVYQVTSGTEDGTFLIMTPGRTLQEVRVFAPPDDRTDSIASSETRLYAVSPSMSLPAQSLQEADPDFWKHP